MAVFVHIEGIEGDSKATVRWQQRTVTEYRKVHTGYRREFAGYRKVFSHYRWEWKMMHESGRGYVYRVWKKVQVPVYRSQATYRQVPVYRNQPVSVLKWVRVPYTYWQCGR